MSVSRVRARWACSLWLSLVTMVGCGSSTTFDPENNDGGGMLDGAAADGTSVDGQRDGTSGPVIPGQDGGGPGPNGPVPNGDANFVLFDGGFFPEGGRILEDGAIVGPGGEQIGVCTAGTSQCTNCKDDDGDGLYDWMDPECTGPLDNDETTYATGIPGDNVDLCKQDCFFDGNSGAGDDRCLWNLKCQTWSKFERCSYEERMASDPKQCPAPTKDCIDYCQPVTPKGCDCFGCCDVYDKAGAVHSVFLSDQCSQANLNDPAKCPVCTKSAACGQPCGECEFCLGKTSLPAKCYVTPPAPDAGSGGPGTDGGGSSGTVGGGTDGGTTGGGTTTPPPVPGWTCQNGGTPCDVNHPCGGGEYCLTGCCIEILR